MDSTPPATTTSASPSRTARAARSRAFMPLAQAMFTVKAGTSWGIPARYATWRATFGPPPAWRAQPTIVSSTWDGATPARRRASATASAPSCPGGNEASDPPNLPIGVRTAPAMTTSRISEPGGDNHRSCRGLTTCESNTNRAWPALPRGPPERPAAGPQPRAGQQQRVDPALIAGDFEAAAAAEKREAGAGRHVGVGSDEGQHAPAHHRAGLGTDRRHLGRCQVRRQVAEAIHVEHLAFERVAGPPRLWQGQTHRIADRRPDLLEGAARGEMAGHGPEDVATVEDGRDRPTEQRRVLERADARSGTHDEREEPV